MRYLILIFILSARFCFSEVMHVDLMKEPFGKDAHLVSCKEQVEEATHCETPFFGHIAEKLIYLHRNVLTHADGPRSHFKPSSSVYMRDAIRKYGFFIGYTYGCDRLMRENDDFWVYKTTVDDMGIIIKSDPVP